MKEKSKILITNSHLKIGGIEESLVNLLKFIDSNKYEIDLFLFEKEGLLLNDIPSNINVYEINNNNRTNKKLIKLLIRVPLLNKMIIRLKIKKVYDYAIAFNGYNNITDMFAALVKAKKKYIWIHSDYKNRINLQSKFKKQYNRMKFKYKYFDKIVAVSKGSMQNFGILMPQYKDKLDYCYNLIDEVEIKEKLQEKPDTTLTGDIKIISVGRLVPQKGFERFVEIIEKLKYKIKDKKIVGYIIGDGPEKEKLIKLVKVKKIEKNVKFLGQKSNPFPLIKQADLFLLTSYIEGFGLVLIEALLCGIPIVVPKVSSGKEICNDIAPPNTSVLVANNIDSIYSGTISAINELIGKNFKYNINEYNQKATYKIKQLLK
jgi:glycosyltransferase involved in cell wall biosynthesis